MRKIKFVLHEVLKFSLIFLLVFVWTRYFCRNLVLAVVFAVILSIAVYATFFFISRKKNNKTHLKIQEKEDAENMFFSLAMGENASTFFVNLASKKHKNISKHKDYVSITYDENAGKTILYFCDDMQGLNRTNFMQIYKKIKKEKASKIVICCKEILDKQLSSFVSNFKEKILLFDQYETYKHLYKFYDCYPEITISYSKEKKMAFKDFVAYSFNKKRTKGYLLSAFILILSSLFVRGSIYYCVISSLCVIFALISYFNPYFNTKNEGDIL